MLERLGILFLLALPGQAGTVDSPSPQAADAFLTLEEALELCFPDCKVQRGTFFLTEAEVEQAEKLAGSKLSSAIVHPYEAFDKDGKKVGTAFFDAHKVRAKKQTLMVAADPTGKILRVEVLAFDEPRQYLPPARWFGQFKGKSLSPALSLDGEVRSMAGATLSARASVAAARRALAVQQVLSKRKQVEEHKRP